MCIRDRENTAVGHEILMAVPQANKTYSHEALYATHNKNAILALLTVNKQTREY